jgi:hypothetical protein
MLTANVYNNLIELIFEFPKELFKTSTIQTISQHYLEICKEIRSDINVKIGDIQLSHNVLTAEPSSVRSDEINFNL